MARFTNTSTAGLVRSDVECGAGVGGKAQRPDVPHDLAGHAQCLAAGGQHPHPGAPAQDLADQTARRSEHVLAVVDHDEGALRGQPLDDRLLE